MKYGKIIKKIIYGIMVLCLMLFIFLLLKPRNTLDVVSSYDTSSERKVVKFDSIVVNKFKSNVNKMHGITIYLDDGYNLKNVLITLEDNKGNILFSQNYDNIQQNTINLNFDVVEDSKNKNYVLKIKSDEVIKLSVGKSDSEYNYIINNDKYVVSFTTLGFKKNHFYLWYPIMAIVILYTLSLFIEGEKNEK